MRTYKRPIQILGSLQILICFNMNIELLDLNEASEYGGFFYKIYQKSIASDGQIQYFLKSSVLNLNETNI